MTTQVNSMDTDFRPKTFDQVIGQEEIKENLRLKIRDVYHEVRGLQSEARMSQIRQDGINQVVQDNNKSNFYSALLESLIFVAIGAAQVWYIKNLLDSKRVI